MFQVLSWLLIEIIIDKDLNYIWGDVKFWSCFLYVACDYLHEDTLKFWFCFLKYNHDVFFFPISQKQSFCLALFKISTLFLFCLFDLMLTLSPQELIFFLETCWLKNHDSHTDSSSGPEGNNMSPSHEPIFKRDW